MMKRWGFPLALLLLNIKFLNIQSLELPKLENNGRAITIFVVTVVQLDNEHHQGGAKAPSLYPPSHPHFILAISNK
jgi:hypothetical protein